MRNAFPRLALALGVLAAGALAGCTSVTSYYDRDDAPEHVSRGDPDPRLVLTRELGGPLAPIVRNINAPHGRLHFAKGLAPHLMATLRPLDIILVRSRPALTRMIIPSHFTHAAIWLGTRAEMTALGAFNLPAVRAQASKLVDGNVLYEAAGDEVRISGIDQITNTDEVVILRMNNMTRARAQAKYGELFARIGTPFDYNFDYMDESRLTCTEIVARIYPELSMPVRYSNGRFAVIPDDVVRRALTGRHGIRVIEQIAPEGVDGFAKLDSERTRSALTSPRPKPVFASFY